jgi:hypothetical protein
MPPGPAWTRRRSSRNGIPSGRARNSNSLRGMGRRAQPVRAAQNSASVSKPASGMSRHSWSTRLRCPPGPNHRARPGPLAVPAHQAERQPGRRPHDRPADGHGTELDGPAPRVRDMQIQMDGARRPRRPAPWRTHHQPPEATSRTRPAAATTPSR